MDFVAALEAQQIHRSGEQNVSAFAGPIPPTANNTATGINENGSIVDGSPSNFSPKEFRKSDSKKRWKNWGWKYSPGGKTSSIEEEPETSSAKTSRHSSPTNSPKHKKSGDQTTATAAVANFLAQSPLRRRTQSNQPQSSTNRINNSTNSSGGATASKSTDRSSAGARLCQTLDDLQDDSNDEFQALIINGRPASVHIVPMSSATQ